MNCANLIIPPFICIVRLSSGLPYTLFFGPFVVVPVLLLITWITGSSLRNKFLCSSLYSLHFTYSQPSKLLWSTLTYSTVGNLLQQQQPLPDDCGKHETQGRGLF